MQVAPHSVNQDTMLTRAVNSQLDNLARVRELNCRLGDLINRLHCSPAGSEEKDKDGSGGYGILSDHLSALEIEARQLSEVIDKLVELESLL